MKTIIHPKGEAWVQAATEWLGGAVAASIAERGHCNLALAGGNTPQPVYAGLAKDPRVDWSRVTLFFSDERAVPSDSPKSNYNAARVSLIDHVAIPEAQVVRMRGDAEDLDAAAAEYDAAMPSVLDIVLLGMGDDGHTASLFPGSRALGEHFARVLPATGPKAPKLRLTFTPPVIIRARQVAMLVTGRDKAEAVVRALLGEYAPSVTPACLARRGTWLLDEPAASLLPLNVESKQPLEWG